MEADGLDEVLHALDTPQSFLGW